MTYQEAIDLYKKKFGGHVKSSYIADILHAHGKTKRKAASRDGDLKYLARRICAPIWRKSLKN